MPNNPRPLIKRLRCRAATADDALARLLIEAAEAIENATDTGKCCRPTTLAARAARMERIAVIEDDGETD